MNKIVVLVIAALVTGQAAAEGIRRRHRQNPSTACLFPHRRVPKFRVEPDLRHQSSDSKQRVEFGGEVSTFESKFDQVGEVSASSALPCPRNRCACTRGPGQLPSTAAHTTQSRQSFYGYRITPTLGFGANRFTSHFTLGGEVGYDFENQNIDTVLFVAPGIGDRQERDESFLILRYFF